MKNIFKTLITIALNTLVLQACWTKKCESPDAEHRSWTMIPEGRTAPMTFKSASGKEHTFDVHAPSYGKLGGGSVAACTGETYYCQIDLDLTNPAIHGVIFWQTNRTTSDVQTIEAGCTNCIETSISYKNDTLISNFTTKGYIRVNSLKILKNYGIFEMNLNDTIYERTN